MRQEIMFAGAGGQGIITASIILAEAAALHEGYHVLQSQAYGPEARGGSSSSHVIISDQEIGYPKVAKAHCMVCLTQESLDRFAAKVRPGGILITDRFFARRLKQSDALIYNLQTYRTVQEQIGLPIVFNVAVLGVLVGLTGVVKAESVHRVLERRVPARFLEQNMQAIDIGLELARTARVWRVATNQGSSRQPAASAVDSASAGPASSDPSAGPQC